MFLGELGEEGSESVEILASPVWWNEHSGDNQLDFGISRPGSRQNLVESLAILLGRAPLLGIALRLGREPANAAGTVCLGNFDLALLGRGGKESVAGCDLGDRRGRRASPASLRRR